MISNISNAYIVQKYQPSCNKREEQPVFKNNNAQAFNFAYPLSFMGQKSEIPLSKVYATIQTQKPFSEGLKGTVYKTEHGGKFYAVKVGKTDSDDFSKEAKILKRVSSVFEDGQNFVAYTKDPKTGRDILVTTFANGESGYLKSKEDFNHCFEKLLALDEAGVLHGDLGMGNMLFEDDGSVNLIDYGEGSLFQTGDKYDEMYPEFVIKTNAVNLEQNGIPDCIRKWDSNGLDSMKLFKDYLNSKADYYSKHSKTVPNDQGNELAILYEENLGKVLKNPSEAVVFNEISRMDLLSTFEQADTEVNYHMYPVMGIRNWHLTNQKANEHLEFIQKQLGSKTISADERLYFEFQEAIAEKLCHDFSEWGASTIDWIKSSLDKDDSELSFQEIQFKKNLNKKSPMPVDLRIMLFNQD